VAAAPKILRLPEKTAFSDSWVAAVFPLPSPLAHMPMMMCDRVLISYNDDDDDDGVIVAMYP